jgi:ABC-type iron transport system FetAB ATPase subunit
MSSAFVPMQICPIITFTAFAAISYASGISLDTTRMLTSLSLLSLLTQPLSQTFQNIPIFVAAFGCLLRLRVEAFLSKAMNLDRRFMMELAIAPPSVDSEIGHHDFELQSMRQSINNLDISTLSGESIRSNINGIPQKPNFLHGTIRLNLDPYSASTDLQITSGLQKSNYGTRWLYKAVLTARWTLVHSHTAKNSYFVLRAQSGQCRILVLNEFTSNVDGDTDALMQRLIKEEFKNHTIISVAHRVETILDFHRIAVLDSGKVIEYDKPSKLLSRPSHFRELYGSHS